MAQGDQRGMGCPNKRVKNFPSKFPLGADARFGVILKDTPLESGADG
jgi:hypothetical protein